MPEHERKVLVHTGPREVKGKQRPQEAGGVGAASVMNTLPLPRQCPPFYAFRVWRFIKKSGICFQVYPSWKVE